MINTADGLDEFGVWVACWPTVQRFLEAVQYWVRGPNGHLQYVDFAALVAAWRARGERVSAETFRELMPMLAAMRAVVNPHINAELERAAQG